jgi:hypothetical protein
LDVIARMCEEILAPSIAAVLPPRAKTESDIGGIGCLLGVTVVGGEALTPGRFQIPGSLMSVPKVSHGGRVILN